MMEVLEQMRRLYKAHCDAFLPEPCGTDIGRQRGGEILTVLFGGKDKVYNNILWDELLEPRSLIDWKSLAEN